MPTSPPVDGMPHILRLELLFSRTPVESCDVIPFVVLRTPDGDIKSADTIETKTRGTISVQYRWLRSIPRFMCGRINCKNSATLQFTKVDLDDRAAGGAASPGDENDLRPFYCSQECLVHDWTERLRARLARRARAVTLPKTADEADQLRERLRMPLEWGEEDVALDNPAESVEVGWLRKYTPSKTDIGFPLELSCRYVFRQADNKVAIGPNVAIRTAAVRELPPPPPMRRLLAIPSGEDIMTHRRNGCFRILTYNVLAEIYASSQEYDYTPDWALAWTYRQNNLLREIERYNADVLCLQEIQEDHFQSHLFPALARLGFEGIFKSKTREAMGRKGKIDGCATFFRTDKFTLVENRSLEYDTIARARLGDGQQQTQQREALKRLSRGNVASLLILRSREIDRDILVANTHIFWDPEKADVKLYQVDVFLEEIEKTLARVGVDTPVAIGGDFNSEPDSAVYDLISTGAVSPEYRAEDPYGTLSSVRLMHKLKLVSAFTVTGLEAPFTNFTRKYVGTLDYIWYQGLRLTALMEIPSEHDLLGIDDTGALPNSRWSSDHIALMAEFQLPSR
eukprot:CAMPEP_0184680406 /NCGR_PEP_ID=MMETSP0312-20130426/3276_1 /TAXON_ID=31354 /ORGANISM="Compsopogon coeruleus, Strain SAG 36.94" /LENGTH=567 /DNA_ID=CAMNT_0027130479 /DNA_START=52 /DNA_END=1755 /DNA_ORIENTATION=+